MHHAVDCRHAQTMNFQHHSTCTSLLIHLGGLYRSCVVGDEVKLTPGVMRSSGDLGHIDEDGRLFYDGRCDRQVKRLGHRINLDNIQQV